MARKIGCLPSAPSLHKLEETGSYLVGKGKGGMGYRDDYGGVYDDHNTDA